MDDRGQDFLFDDGSSKIFAAALLSVFCVPALVQRAVRYAFAGETDRVRRREEWCGCENCHLKAERLRSERRRWYNTWGRPGNLVFFGAWAALLALVWSISRSGVSGGEVFDPFDILGISKDATDREISKAYRAMSLRYHPDKNLGDPEAPDRFVKINKAYEALTDELSRENYQKYGNPDGYTGTKFGVGLPPWVHEQGNVVVVLYLVVLIVVFPALVGRWWWVRSKRMNDSVLTETFVMYRQAFIHMIRFRDIVTAYASALEFEDYFKKEPPAKYSRLAAQLKKIERFDLKNAKFFGQPQNFQVQAAILVNAYLARLPLSSEFQAPLNSLLAHTEPLTNSLCDGVITIGRQEFRNVYTVRPYMNGHITRVITAIHVAQCLAQAMGDRDSPLYQLPHFTSKEVGFCTTKSKNVKTVYEFAALGHDRQREILRSFTDAQLLDVNEFCLRYPEVEIDFDEPIVEDETDQTVHSKDRAMVRVRLKVKRGAGTAKSPCCWRLPSEKHENWSVILGDADRDLVLDCKRLTPSMADSDGNYSVDLHFWAPVPGKYNYVVHALVDCYLGCDRYKTMKVNILAPAEPEELPVYFDTDDESEYEDDDEYDDEDDDEDEDDEDEDEDEDEDKDEDEGANEDGDESDGE